MKKELPVPHPTREMIEQGCPHNIEKEVCYRKYAAERLNVSNYMIVQNACIAFYAFEDVGWDKVQENFMDYYRKWNGDRDLGVCPGDSYSKRYREVWNAGLIGERQMLTLLGIYNLVRTENHNMYREMVDGLASLKVGYFKRNGWRNKIWVNKK